MSQAALGGKKEIAGSLTENFTSSLARRQVKGVLLSYVLKQINEILNYWRETNSHSTRVAWMNKAGNLT